MGTGPDPKEKANSGNVAKETAESGGLFAGIKKIMKWVGKKIGLLLDEDDASTATAAPAEVKKHVPLFPALTEKLQNDQKKVIDDLSALLRSETVKDEADLKILNDAKSFIEKPTENLEEITKHNTNVGHVLGGYYEPDIQTPPAIDALNRHLRALLCVNRIKFVEEEIAKGNTASPEVKNAMKMADDRATVYSRDYKDDSFLIATNKLQERLR